MHSQVTLYDAHSIEELPWPDTEQSKQAKKFLIPFITHTPAHFIDNVQTDMFALKVDDIVLPVTVNEAELENSYVCSPYTQYISCAEENLNKIDNPLLRYPLVPLVGALKGLLKWGKINKVVIVNNWLFSTNLHPKLTIEQVQAIKIQLSKQFPNHAILFRSVLNYEDEPTYSALVKNNFEMIASRKVYLTNSQEKAPFRSRMFKSDLKLLQNSTYSLNDHSKVSLAEAPRLNHLYKMLYIDKYSALSPQLNANFFKLALENQVLTFKTFKKEGQTDAVVGYFHQNGFITSPLFGYDTNKPQSEGLYRLIATQLSLEGQKQGTVIHHSSGAGSYKKLRRAKEEIEYLAVYSKHLPLSRRTPWKFLKTVLNRVGIPLLKKYDF